MIKSALGRRAQPRFLALLYFSAIITSGIATAAVLALVLLHFLSGSVLAAMGNTCGGIFAFSHGFLASSRFNYVIAAVLTTVFLLQSAFMLGGGARIFRASHRHKHLRSKTALRCPAMAVITGKKWADHLHLSRIPELEAVTIGLLRPRILVSSGMVSELSQSELAAVVAHEDAHRRGRDNFLIAVAKSISLTQFYLPGPRFAFRQMRTELEMAADRKAVTEAGGARAVASALAGIARASRLADRAGAPAVQGQLDVAVTGSGDLAERVYELLGGYGPRQKFVWKRLALFGASIAVVLALFSASAFAIVNADQRGAFVCFIEHEQGTGPNGVCTVDHLRHAEP